MRTKSKETKSGWNAFCDLVILSYCVEIQQLRHELRLEKVVKRSVFVAHDGTVTEKSENS